MKEKLGLGDDCWNWSFGVLATALAVAVAVSSLVWPISWHYTSRNRDMMENGYEEVVDRGDRFGQSPVTTLRKVDPRRESK